MLCVLWWQEAALGPTVFSPRDRSDESTAEAGSRSPTTTWSSHVMESEPPMLADPPKAAEVRLSRLTVSSHGRRDSGCGKVTVRDERSTVSPSGTSLFGARPLLFL